MPSSDNDDFQRLKTARVLVWLALLVTIPTLYMGAFTTTIGAGMVFPDWPLSNGSLNPEGWTSDIDMFAEHSHRLFAGLTALLSVGVAWAHKRHERRAWVRKWTYAAVVLVFGQALLGGLRVLMDDVDLAIPHAFAGQTFLCMMATVALAHTRFWQGLTFMEGYAAHKPARTLRRVSVLLAGLIFAQLVIAALMRHNGAGLAIHTFPHSNAAGDWLPAYWNFGVAIHFAHRVMAVVITLVFVYFSLVAWRSAAFAQALRPWLLGLTFLLVLQILLGASVIWTVRMPVVTTLHVLVGAILLCGCFIMSVCLYKPFIEREMLTRSEGALKKH